MERTGAQQKGCHQHADNALSRVPHMPSYVGLCFAFRTAMGHVTRKARSDAQVRTLIGIGFRLDWMESPYGFSRALTVAAGDWHRPPAPHCSGAFPRALSQ